MSLHRRRRSSGALFAARALSQWRTVLWLTVIWVMLWGDVSVGNVLAGVVLAVVVILLMPLPSIAAHGTLRPWPFFVLVGRFVVDLVVASAEVSWLALRPGRMPHGGVIGVKLRNPSDIYLTVTAELSSLVPGSIVVEAHRLTGMLYLHVLDLDMAGGAERVREDTLALEARVLHALASNEELRAAGLYKTPGGVGGAPSGGGAGDGVGAVAADRHPEDAGEGAAP